MKLINTDGLAFIGPGSEWYWTAMSGLVLAVTFFAITDREPFVTAQPPPRSAAGP